jgi:Bacterial capsule synthesis protein PGA_cap
MPAIQRTAFPALASRTAVLGCLAFSLAAVLGSGVAHSAPQSQSPSAPAPSQIQPATETQPAASDAKTVAPAPSVSEGTPPNADAASAPAIKPLAYDEIVVTAVGDVMLGTTFPDASGSDLPPNDGAGLLDEVTPILKHGDLVFGNLEGPLVEGGDSAKCHGKKEGTCYAFRVPTRYGAYLKSAGFTVMGLANNHAMDFGAEGRASSRHVLDEQGIAHSGEVGDIAHLTVKDRKIDVIAFATYPGAYNLLDLEDALETIRQARQEADLVIVSFHGGAEGATHQHVAAGDEKFLGEDRGDLRKFAHAAVDAGAQLVLGSGPHVVRAMEVYHGKLIAYSLGNFATYGPFNLNGENGISMVLEAHLLPDGDFLRGQIFPVKQEKPGGPKLDPELRIVPILRALSHTDFPATGVVAGPRGELWLPGTRIPECSNAPDILEQRPGTTPCGIFP